ncbi:MAG: V-type ATP synthase subunit A [Defluviitaleaceae bacterium]|nr:V-type ATP synthase subunit A [Defluviitaleaceae bacterium]
MSVESINGPVITVTTTENDFAMAEMVMVGGLPGEVISLKPGVATIQVYENTAGLKIGTAVKKLNAPMSLTLRPGLVGGIFDGVFRNLRRNVETEYITKITACVGDFLSEGDTFAIVEESISYLATIPPDTSGKVIQAAEDGVYSADSQIILLETETGKIPLSLSQTWPIRVPRPVRRRLSSTMPLITGQRVIDSLFPIAKGGTCAIPGGFGTGKTMTQHQIAKHCDADIIIYIGCGERGNEMTEVLEDFAKLRDTKGQPLLSRTILIANTSDMPVAAREASIYTGITLAECYRDMGYHVAIMADSTSRWAEALRELSSRLGEIPAEEGYPAYLATRLSAFYSRAGYVQNLSGTEGSVTIIAAVSPQGGDFSEPVTLHTKRFTGCFWALDKNLAYARHFPAINPLQSYSNFTDLLDPWYIKNISPLFPKYREKIINTLAEESVLLETIKITGEEALSPDDHITLSTAKKIRKTFTSQNAYDPADTYTPLAEQFKMMETLIKENLGCCQEERLF